MGDDAKSPLSIEIKDETVRTVVDAVLDVLSAPREMLAWLGDSIRVHRARSALKCFMRTKEIAEQAGLSLQAPPVKFISQYIEYASLEEEDDDTLIEWWARILVNAASTYDDKHVFFTNVLRQVSAVELEILEIVVRNGRRNYRIALASDAEFRHEFEFNEEELKLTDQLNDQSASAAIDSVIDVFEIPGVLVLDVFVDDKDSNQWQVFHPDYSDEELAAWQILQSLQLVRLDYKKFQRNDVHYRVRLAMLTYLGTEFYFSCHDHELYEANSKDVRFERKKINKRTHPNGRE